MADPTPPNGIIFRTGLPEEVCSEEDPCGGTGLFSRGLNPKRGLSVCEEFDELGFLFVSITINLIDLAYPA